MIKEASVFLVVLTVFAVPVSADQDINLNINFDFSGLSDVFSGDDENESEDNNTYGERVGGQSVHTDEEPSEAEVGKNNQDFQITEDTDKEDEGFISRFMNGLRGLL